MYHKTGTCKSQEINLPVVGGAVVLNDHGVCVLLILFPEPFSENAANKNIKQM